MIMAERQEAIRHAEAPASAPEDLTAAVASAADDLTAAGIGN